ncbi:MAG: DUF3794 domain-containing protein [Clostridia bacterium]|nr:DUF3794 domain-containing protein [Clostridia bacterium]
MDLSYKNIKVCSWAKKQKNEYTASSDIIVPDTKPDIYRILCVNASANLEEQYIRKDKIIYSGTVNYTVLYVGENDKNIIYTIEHTAPFNHQADLTKSPSDAMCITKCIVASTDYTVKNSRKISAMANIYFDTDTIKHEDISFLEAIEGEDCVPCKTENISADAPISLKEVEFTVSDTISVPLTEGSEICDFNIRIDSLDAKTVNNKAILKGNLPAKIFYSSGEELSTYETEFSFTEIIDLDMATVDSTLHSYFNVANVSYNLNETEEETTIDADITVKGYIRVFEKLECSYVCDAYSPDYSYSVSKNSFPIETYHNLGDASITVKESLSVSENGGGVSRVHYMNVYPSCKKTVCDNSSLKISGVASVCVIYSDSEDVLNSVKKDIPFETELPCSCDYETSVFDVSVSAQNYNYVLSSSEIQTRTVLKISAAQMSYISQNLVSDFAEDKASPIDKSSQASITVCYPSGSETLWEYAQKYNTTVSEIAAVNGIDQDAPLTSSKPIVIPKRRI